MGETSDKSAFGQPEAIELDWQEKSVSLNKGKFVHTLKRPSRELILEREEEIKSETPLNRDGSFADAETDEQDRIDAKYYERVKAQEPTGYDGKTVPELHKANAFRLIYKRYIYIPETVDLFGEIIEIHEAIGDGDDPDALAIHFLRNPLERDVKKMNSAINNGKTEPDKRRGRGLQKYVKQSYLKKAIAFYENHFVNIENATVGGNFYTVEQKDAFLGVIDPLIARRVVDVLIKAIIETSQD